MSPEERSIRSRLGGYATAARYDSREINAKARAVYRESFLLGHECRLCPAVSIPVGLPEPERARRAAALRKGHYLRLAQRSAKARAKGKAAQERAPRQGRPCHSESRRVRSE